MQGGVPYYATTHADSILFACSISVIVALRVEERGRRRAALYLFALPLILAGVMVNNRRLAWVAIAWVIATYYVLAPWTRRKRALTRAVLLSLPLIAAYLAVGWTSSSTVFAPARLVASVVSSDVDGSTRWRDLENFNLVYTIAQHPVLGSGLGHEYIERVRLPDVSAAFPMFRYQPHNGVLALWAFGGGIGFTAHWLLFVAGIFFAARAYRYAVAPMDRAAALSCVAAIVIYMISAYGDTTLGSWPGVFIVGPAIALSGNLAVATGAWPTGGASAASGRSPRPASQAWSSAGPPGARS
jgi:O-antigen ligase/polysaccharide polymerase Wzy-like membrane protein